MHGFLCYNSRSAPAKTVDLMRRPSLNFLIDAAAFTAFVFMTGSGVLMRYVLPPGSGHFTTVWGLDRHQWGAIHFWLAVGLLTILAFHVWVHRRWIVTVVRGRPREGSGPRIGLGIVGLVALLALGAAPLLSPVDRVDGEFQRRGPSRGALETDDSIRGSMTLREVEQTTGVPASYILQELGIPPDLSTDERLGRLARAHQFSVQDVRLIVGKYEEGD